MPDNGHWEPFYEVEYYTDFGVKQAHFKNLDNARAFARQHPNSHLSEDGYWVEDPQIWVVTYNTSTGIKQAEFTSSKEASEFLRQHSS